MAGADPLRPAFARQARGGALSRRRRRIRLDPRELQQHHERRAGRAQRPRHQRDDSGRHEAPADRREAHLRRRLLRRRRPRLDGRAQGELPRRRDLDRWPPGARAPGARPRSSLSSPRPARATSTISRRASSTRSPPRPACRTASSSSPGRTPGARLRRLVRPSAGWRSWRCATVGRRAMRRGSSAPCAEEMAAAEALAGTGDALAGGTKVHARSARRLPESAPGDARAGGAARRRACSRPARRRLRQRKKRPPRSTRVRSSAGSAKPFGDCCGPPRGRSPWVSFGISSASTRPCAAATPAGSAATRQPARSGGDPGPSRFLPGTGPFRGRRLLAGGSRPRARDRDLPRQRFHALQPRLRPGPLRAARGSPRQPRPGARDTVSAQPLQMATDADLASLRERPEFAALLERARRIDPPQDAGPAP